mgnify:FL=1
MSDNRKYVSFMEDEKLLAAIERLYNRYQKAFSEASLKKLNKNIIDPFKFQFDTAFIHGGNAEATIDSEAFRQSDKSIANAIGEFQQELLGAIDGFEESPDLPCDVRKKDNSIFAEVKNKHNTMNVRSAAGVYEELTGLAKAYPKAMCYLVEIIAKHSTDKVWSVTVNEMKQEHPRIHEISADKFYALATGKENALLELTQALPMAISDFMKAKGKKPIGQQGAKASAYQELCQLAEKDGNNLTSQMYKLALPEYMGFGK